ncbi:MAG: malonic semialdehyde reductase [Ilumatobacteraceae bacterium]
MRHLNDDALALLFTEAHTAHDFVGEPLTNADLRRMHDIVKMAPTSMNSQPLRVVYVQSPDARARLIGHLSEGNKAKTTSAPTVAILCYDSTFHERFPTVLPHFAAARDLFLDETPRRTFAAGQAWLQAGYFILAARSLGYVVGPMTGFNSQGVDDDLLAGTTLTSFCVVNIGQPGENAYKARNPRVEFDDAVTIL